MMSAITISKNTVTFQRVFPPSLLETNSKSSGEWLKVLIVPNHIKPVLFYNLTIQCYFIIMRLKKVMYIREELMFYIYVNVSDLSLNLSVIV